MFLGFFTIWIKRPAGSSCIYYTSFLSFFKQFLVIFLPLFSLLRPLIGSAEIGLLVAGIEGVSAEAAVHLLHTPAVCRLLLGTLGFAKLLLRLLREHLPIGRGIDPLKVRG